MIVSNNKLLIYNVSRILNDIDNEVKKINSMIKEMQRKAKKEAPVSEREIFLSGCKSILEGVRLIKRETFKLRFKTPIPETIEQLKKMYDEVKTQRVGIEQIAKEIL